MNSENNLIFFKKLKDIEKEKANKISKGDKKQYESLEIKLAHQQKDGHKGDMGATQKNEDEKPSNSK